jgi:hypothetical protein
MSQMPQLKTKQYSYSAPRSFRVYKPKPCEFKFSNSLNSSNFLNSFSHHVDR